MPTPIFRKRKDNGIPFLIIPKKGKKISQSTGTLKPTGIKIKSNLKKPKSPDSKKLIEGVEERILTAPKSVQESIKEIEFKDKEAGDDYLAMINTKTRKIAFNVKPNLSKKKYEILAEHELQHQWFNDRLAEAKPKIFKFIEMAQKIRPFSPDLWAVNEEIASAHFDHDERNETEKMLEYADEVNSNVAEILIAKKLNVPVKDLSGEDEKSFNQAKKLVKELHS